MCLKTFCSVVFGCKVNQFESQFLRESLLSLGLSEVEEDADIYVVDTCTVTDRAFKEGYSLVRRLARRNPSSMIIATGCATASNKHDFCQIGGVEIFREKDRITNYLASKLRLQHNAKEFISSFNGHTRAFLKVQDGCDLDCSFCIIPKVRGSSRSISIDHCIKQAKMLADNGYKEIVITGVHLGSYGKSGLVQLLKNLLKIDSIARLRLSSIEVNEVSEDLINLIRHEPRICPHLHIPLQSGDDDVLRAMRRRYNTTQFLKVLDKLRLSLDAPSFTSDVMVGFPTETDANFDNTLKFIEKAEFSRVHIFPYSPRQGTDAAKLKDLPSKIKRQRLKILEGLVNRIARGCYRRFIGRSVEVLVEKDNCGYTERYLRAKIIHGTVNKNQLVRCKVISSNGCELNCLVVKVVQ